MGGKSSQVVSQKISELQGQDTCGGDLHQHIIFTTEDKVRLHLQELISAQTHRGIWPAHFSAAVSLLCTGLSFSQFKEGFSLFGLGAIELRVLVFALCVMFVILGIRSLWKGFVGRTKSTVEKFLGALDPTLKVHQSK